MTPPIFVAGRTCSIVVPPGSWYGYDLPNLVDCGEYVVGWGMAYNNDEYADPFRTLLVKIEKSTFSVVQYQEIILNGIDPSSAGYESPIWAVSDGTYLYVGTWADTDITNTYWIVYKLDIATLTVQATSNVIPIVSASGASAIRGNSFNEAAGMAYIYGDSVVWGSTGSGYFGVYKISTNTYSMFGGDLTIGGASGTQVSSTGTVYRLWQQGTYPTYTMHLDSMDLTTQSITNIGSFTPWFFNESTTNQTTNAFYLDEPNGLIYASLSTVPNANEWVQISTSTGQIVGTPVADTTFTTGTGAAQFGWQGYELCEDNNSAIYLRGADGTLYTQPNIVIPPDDANYFFWDCLFYGTGEPLYLSTLTDDLKEGDTLTWYEFVPPFVPPSTVLGGPLNLDYPDPGPPGTAAPGEGGFRVDLWRFSAIGPVLQGCEVWVLKNGAAVPQGYTVVTQNGVTTSTGAPDPSTLATLYDHSSGYVPLQQPLITDAFGHVRFYVAGLQSGDVSPDCFYTFATYTCQGSRSSQLTAKLFNSYPDQYVGISTLDSSS